MAQYRQNQETKHLINSIMKIALVLCALVAVVVSRPEESFYNPNYDSFDANELAGNVRLLKNYAKCFLNKGPCTSEGSDFKKMIPEALHTRCGKCSPKQRELIRTVVKAMQQKLSQLWQELSKKHDPTGKYRAGFEGFLNGSN